MITSEEFVRLSNEHASVFQLSMLAEYFFVTLILFFISIDAYSVGVIATKMTKKTLHLYDLHRHAIV